MICIDANVLIEIILGRKNAEICRKYIDSHKEDMATTVLSLDIVMYYTESNKLSLRPVEHFLRLFTWLAITDTDAEAAFKYFEDKDFEDALQISCAVREGCSRFVTLDRGLAKKYSKEIPIDLLV
jgi:predicted nucleic acid-binding protein